MPKPHEPRSLKRGSSNGRVLTLTSHRDMKEMLMHSTALRPIELMAPKSLCMILGRAAS